MSDETSPKPASFMETLPDKLNNLQNMARDAGSHAVRREQEHRDFGASIPFEIIEKYCTGEISGPDAVKALKMAADFSLRTYYVYGSNIMWPNILQSATQIAIAERSKK